METENMENVVQPETTKKTTTRKKTTKKKETVKKIPDNQLVEVVSHVNGKLVYISSRTGLKWEFYERGDSDYMEFSELRTLVASQRSFVSKGWIHIPDEDVRKALNIERFQCEMMTEKDIEDVFEMEASEIETTLKEASVNTKSIVFGEARKRYLNGKLTNINIIRAIESVCGAEIIEQ